MSSFFSRLLGARAPLREAKASRAAKFLAMHALGGAQWTTRNSAALTREGYERNAVCHRCVRMVAEAAASVPWLVYEGQEESSDHPLLALIEQPNPLDTSVSFIETICANLLLYGNAYIEPVFLDGALREFYALRPDRMSVETGRDGWPAAYVYRAMGEEARYEMRAGGVAPILHIKLFNPLDDHYGFAPLAAAQVALDTHNAASFWNKALLDNSARPSGALVYAGPEGAHLTDAQFDRLKQELEENFSGADNAGRPLLLEGGLDWKALSLSPKDMDFAESKAGAAREIALAFGVPPLLLGLPGDNTFANYAEANRAFWRQTVLPLVLRVQKSFQSWLRPAYGEFRLDYNADRLDALASERAAEWERVGKAPFLTLDEQREAVGYGPAPRNAFGNLAPAERRHSPGQPRVPAGSPQGGQWTNGGGGAQIALNIDPSAGTRLDGSIDLAQGRGRGRGFGAGSEFETPAQRDRLDTSGARAEEAQTRVREIDPLWRPRPTLSDPNDIEARITRNEDLTRQANERYADYLRDKYGDFFPRGPLGVLTGPRAQLNRNDNAETLRGRERENETADICWLYRNDVEQLAQPSDQHGIKQPDFRINGEIFDAFAPITGNRRNIWSYAEKKIGGKQTGNLIINLRDSPLTFEELAPQFRDYKIDRLQRLWIIDRFHRLHHLF